MTDDDYAAPPALPEGWLALVRLPLAVQDLFILAGAFPGAVLENGAGYLNGTDKALLVRARDEP